MLSSSKNLISVVMKSLSKSKILILIFATLSMLGCSTGYYPSESFGGYGYSEMKLAEATYIVRFRGNGATHSGQSQALSLRRAAELCLQQGYQYFKIEDSDLTLNKSTYRTPTHVDTHSNYNTNSFRSGSISAQSHSTISGGDLIVVERPVSSFLVKMYKKPINGSLQASTILSNFKKPKEEEKKKETFCNWVMKVSNDSI